MAYSEEQWLKAKDYYEAGYTLSKIKDKTGIARNTISQRAKRELWEHSRNVDYIEAKELIATKKGTIKEHTVLILDEVAEESIRHKKLINDNATKLSAKLSKMVDEIEEPQDLRHLVEANDKLAITLKVADRHAPKTVIENSNQQLNNTVRFVRINSKEDMK